MQIYTRTGDQGTTRIIGGQSLHKDDPRIQAYGSIDEINSLLGLIRSQNQNWPELNRDLLKIQDMLFDCGNDFATALPEKYPYKVKQTAVDWLEEKIDTMSQATPEIEYFIIPGGSSLASWLHYGRTVCRRAERDCVSFIRSQANYNPPALKFINRLSDYLFAAGRLANHRQGQADIEYQGAGKVFHQIDKKRLQK